MDPNLQQPLRRERVATSGNNGNNPGFLRQQPTQPQQRQGQQLLSGQELRILIQAVLMFVPFISISMIVTYSMVEPDVPNSLIYIYLNMHVALLGLNPVLYLTLNPSVKHINI